MFVKAVEVINMQLLSGAAISLLQSHEYLVAVFQQEKQDERGGEEHPVGIITTFSMMSLGEFVSKVSKTERSLGL